MTAELEVIVGYGIGILVIGFFTDFFGLGGLVRNRGHWYHIVDIEELHKVLTNLYKLNAYKDSDGMLSEHIRIKAYASDYEGNLFYRVKVPNWIFKDAKAKMTDDLKLKLLGLTED